MATFRRSSRSCIEARLNAKKLRATDAADQVHLQDLIASAGNVAHVGPSERSHHQATSASRASVKAFTKSRLQDSPITPTRQILPANWPRPPAISMPNSV